MTLLSSVDFPPLSPPYTPTPPKKEEKKLVTILYGLSGNFCKSYVLVKYFLLFYFAFVQFILLCLFRYSDVTILFKIKVDGAFCFGLLHMTNWQEESNTSLFH